MSNILILTSGFNGIASANGICAKQIVNSFCEKKDNVFIISLDNDQQKNSHNNISICINKKKQTKNKYYNFIKNIVLGSLVLNYDKNAVQNIINHAKIIIDKNNIDIVISFYFPIETLLAGLKIKKNYSHIKWIIYELDSVSDGIASGYRFSKLLTFPHHKALNRIYKHVDKILILNCHKKKWNDDFEKYKSKVLVTDLPLLYDNTNKVKKKTNNLKTVFLYSGGLNPYYRNPNRFLSIFSKILNKNKILIRFFSSGCDSEIEKFEHKLLIEKNSFIDQQLLNEQIRNADFLINIGNKFSNSLPSKLIHYISFGKPIIHFSLQKNDVCEQYIRKYPLGLVIYYNDSVLDASNKINNFINKYKSKSVRFLDVRNKFSQCVPETSVDLIKKVILE